MIRIKQIVATLVLLMIFTGVFAQMPYGGVPGGQSAGTLLSTNKEEKDRAFNFVFVSDPLVGDEAGKAEEALKRVVNEVNLDGTVAFVIVTGDVTVDGSYKSLMIAKRVLNKLNCGYYVVPGDKDLSRANDAGVHFEKFFNDDKFRVQINDYVFIGVNSAQRKNAMKGFLAPDDIVWAARQLKNVGKKKAVFVITHKAMSNGKTSNWWELTDVLRKHNIQAIIGGHKGGNEIRNYDAIKGIMGAAMLNDGALNANYNLCAVVADTLYVYAKQVGQKAKVWHKMPIERQLYVEGDENAFPRTDYGINAKNKDVDAVWAIEAGKSIYSSPVCVGENVVFVDESGLVRCVSKKKGKDVWEFKAMSTVMGDLVAEGEKVMFGSYDKMVYCLDVNDGKLLWIADISSSAEGSPRVEDGLLYIGAEDKKLRAINTVNGEVMWGGDIAQGQQNDMPSVADGVVMITDSSNSLSWASAVNGQLIGRWTANNVGDEDVEVRHVYAKGKAFVSVVGKYLAVVDIASGRELWRTNEYAVRGSMAVSEDGSVVYVKCVGEILAFDANSSEKKLIWEKQLPIAQCMSERAMTVKGGKLLFGTDIGEVCCLDAADGTQLWWHLVSNETVNKVYAIDANSWIVTTVGGDVIRLED